jgi:hypothetical protein
MRIETIQQMIEAAVDHERQTDHVVALLIKVTAMANSRIDVETARILRDHCIAYVNLVPEFFNTGLKRASEMGIEREMNFMLNELESYWFLQKDFIPDKYGLVGIMDDAYASNYFLQSLSDFCARQSNRPLIDRDLAVANTFARNIIGERIAQRLEKQVDTSINVHLSDNHISKLFKIIFSSAFVFENPLALSSLQKAIQFQRQMPLGAAGIVI